MSGRPTDRRDIYLTVQPIAKIAGIIEPCQPAHSARGVGPGRDVTMRTAASSGASLFPGQEGKPRVPPPWRPPGDVDVDVDELNLRTFRVDPPAGCPRMV
jgi:hypothetical protein